MFDISIRYDVKAIARSLDNLAHQQLPFATAQALTGLAQQVQAGEREAMGSIFDRPTPFTLNSVGVKGARKDDLQAIVYVKDIAAAYLEPYEVGGSNKLNSRALLKPVNVTLNRYGNLSRKKLSQLKSRADVFIGKVTGKSGTVTDGVWQRIAPARGKPGGLKLLVRFSDAHQAKQRLDFRKRAEQIVRTNFDAQMRGALAKAMATAR